MPLEINLDDVDEHALDQAAALEVAPAPAEPKVLGPPQPQMFYCRRHVCLAPAGKCPVPGCDEKLTRIQHAKTSRVPDRPLRCPHCHGEPVFLVADYARSRRFGLLMMRCPSDDYTFALRIPRIDQVARARRWRGREADDIGAR